MMKGKRTRVLLLALVALLLTLPAAAAAPPAAHAQTSPTSRTFPETGKTVRGRFLQYWDQHGGLAQQGYPISDEIGEVSPFDGKTYTVQYFERAVFEMHPENAPPYDVLLSLVGAFANQARYPQGAPGQTANTSPGAVLFAPTGHRVGGGFLDYWNTHGGLAQQGYPISEEFAERNVTDGQTYTVQYFERAVFEYHPTNPAPYRILLSLLGSQRYQARYSGGSPPLPPPHPVVGSALPTNCRYDGATQNGIPEGQGTCVWSNGDRYTGAWHSGQPNGQGTLDYHGVGTYQGSFVAGKRSGQGTMTWSDGDAYTGAWANDLMNGYGTYSFHSGARYAGNWVNGRMDGQGTYRYPDGRTLAGQWRNNTYVGP